MPPGPSEIDLHFSAFLRSIGQAQDLALVTLGFTLSWARPGPKLLLHSTGTRLQ